jgi:hypothetical protein
MKMKNYSNGVFLKTFGESHVSVYKTTTGCYHMYACASLIMLYITYIY